jgi:hypothetical protein
MLGVRARHPSSRSPDHDIVGGCECGLEPWLEQVCVCVVVIDAAAYGV